MHIKGKGMLPEEAGSHCHHPGHGRADAQPDLSTTRQQLPSNDPEAVNVPGGRWMQLWCSMAHCRLPPATPHISHLGLGGGTTMAVAEEDVGGLQIPVDQAVGVHASYPQADLS